MPGSQIASVTPGDPSARGGRALKFGLALFQLPAFALLSSAKLSCSTWFLLGTSLPSYILTKLFTWFLLGTPLSPSYILTKLFLLCVWVSSTLNRSSLSSQPII